mmetsp:Transcript_61884/g.182772  ORF Transcript_61884/g.182772 Transcript_61884/m.182772 type:complete len:680 (-) Transcript_61884:1375-3414(-)
MITTAALVAVAVVVLAIEHRADALGYAASAPASSADNSRAIDGPWARNSPTSSRSVGGKRSRARGVNLVERRWPRRRSAGDFFATPPALSSRARYGEEEHGGQNTHPRPAARVTGPPPSSEVEASALRDALRFAGFGAVEFDSSPSLSASIGDERGGVSCYVHSKATGMLKLVGAPAEFEAPRWVPIVRGEEHVLVSNGWSFLDPDESEQNSAFDVDAANVEGLYRPKWGQTDDSSMNSEGFRLSSLGFGIDPMSHEEVLAEADVALSASSTAESGNTIDARSVLLDGATDPPGIKRTNNGWSFSGPSRQDSIPRGIFVCAVGGLPLFSTTDLSPSTASSGWLSFSLPLGEDHVERVQPEADADDRRVEVVCARSRCHLGHYFGKGDGYCINASALNFIPAAATTSGGDVSSRLLEDGRSQEKGMDYNRNGHPSQVWPLSWHALEDNESLSPSIRTLRDALLPQPPRLKSAVLGAGCFWHVESALRRLPGVVGTSTGYAGGAVPSPSYEQVCKSPTGHAEVVRVEFDSDVLPPRVLMDCFLAMHDPTKVRAHGKHAAGTGQYRSCTFFACEEMAGVAAEALRECHFQLGKELSTELRLMPDECSGGQWFWLAEDRHQKHDEKVGKVSRTNVNGNQIYSISVQEWLREYGRRSASVLGNAETVQVAASEPGDDGMAMMMI